MASTAITIRGLTKRYQDVQALDGVDLDINTGEVFALLGPNGAGKSTTVEILEGYRQRDSGEVSVLGTDPQKADRAWRNRVGIVLQSVADVGDLTVTESIQHFAGYYREPRDVQEVIDLVGLSAKAKTRASALSGGQRRRLDVALGIIGNPELLFLDEPTTGFDPKARRQFWQLISQLAKDGTTIVLTTHYLDEAEALADQVAVIVAGKVVAQGTPATLGGRATAEAVVSWAGPDGRQEVETDSPTALIRKLSQHFSGEIPELSVHRPSLEDIYLTLIQENHR